MNKDSIHLTIPSKPDYFSLVRLTTSSISNKCGMNIDEIEDIKVAIGEACANSLCFTDMDFINIEYILDEEELIIKVSNVKEDIPEGLEETRDRELGILIIKSLMDKVIFNETGIEMTKFLE
ncbi:ATP-binding protein [Tissierella sp. Yu-01]|uniref:ATP-binding protein n=1 Tax=Tissierella sp. Yu-01 TaxID=3035694 RepID=UPI00240D4F4D|nr:ATP-binding protein [Tissierella sp. Yu-01]WFA08326.1 ATP-binding protein [Tissierella sp. Yu-01]